MNNQELLGAWVGLIGGTSGFVALMIQSRQLYLDAPRIKIISAFAVNLDQAKEFYSIEVVNKGSKQVTITSIGVNFSNKMHSPFNFFPVEERSGNSFPYRLDSHSSSTWLVGKISTDKAISEIKGKPYFRSYVNLATGKTRKSKRFKLPPSN